MNFIKIDGTIVNLDNVVAIQNRDELGKDYTGVGWMQIVIPCFSPVANDLDYIYFEDKPCVRMAYNYLVNQCSIIFADKVVSEKEDSD